MRSTGEGGLCSLGQAGKAELVAHREIGEDLQIKSTNGVNDHLKALERKGYLMREDLKSRALRVLSLTSGSMPARAVASTKSAMSACLKPARRSRPP